MNALLTYPTADSAARAAFLAYCQAAGLAVRAEDESAGTTTLFAVASAETALVKGDLGIDISHWQRDSLSSPDEFDKLARAGVKFAWIKATERLGVDAEFWRFWETLGGMGVKRGPYSFFRPELIGAAQAEFFYEKIYKDPRFVTGELPIALDIEYHESMGMGKNPDINSAPMVAFRKANEPKIHGFLERLESLTGVRPILYTSARAWKGMTMEPEWVKDYRLWLANYRDPATNPGPDIPRGATAAQMIAWQFSNGDYRWSRPMEGLQIDQNLWMKNG